MLRYRKFLLQLPESVDLADIYGTDTDAVSICIARLNMALKYPDADVEEICEHITEKNFLTEYDRMGFDTIIGNPPWGYAFSNEDKAVLKTRYATASGRNTESYDVFIERALEILVPDGTLAFVLPEAVLNVKAHMRIRTILLQGSSVKSLTFLGDMFDGVQCPCILLQLIATGKPLSTAGMMIEDRTRTYTIAMERTVVPENFSFRMTDEEYRVLEKIKIPFPSVIWPIMQILHLALLPETTKVSLRRENGKFGDGTERDRYLQIPHKSGKTVSAV